MRSRIFSVVVTIMWISIALPTIREASSGKLFIAPCLSEKAKQAKQVPADVEAGELNGAAAKNTAN